MILNYYIFVEFVKKNNKWIDKINNKIYFLLLSNVCY